MSDIITEKIAVLIKQVVEDMNFRLYDVNYNIVSRILKVYIDRADNGVTIEDCKRVSMSVSAALDSSDLIKSSYTLEVSSPGIERLLTRPEHYEWVLGKLAEFDLGSRKIKGHIRGVGEEGVTIAWGSGEEFILFSAIVKARVMEEIDYGKRR